MKEQLEYTFSLVNEWLKFAEAKSAALLATNGAVLFGTSNLVKDIELNVWVMVPLIAACICFFVSLTLCLSSFVPSLNLPLIHKKYEKTNYDNLLFFDHIARHTVAEFLTTVRGAREVDESNDGPYVRMLAEQIVANSTIASYKYRVFNKAIWLALLGLFALAIASQCYFWL